MVGEDDTGCQSGGVGTINVGSDVRAGRHRIDALYVDRLHKRVEVTYMEFKNLNGYQTTLELPADWYSGSCQLIMPPAHSIVPGADVLMPAGHRLPRAMLNDIQVAACGSLPDLNG